MVGLEKAELALKRVHGRKEETDKMIKELKALDETLEKNGEMFYDEIAKSHKNFMFLKNMTEEQIRHNFTLDNDLLDAETHLLRGLLQFLCGSYFKGFFNFRKSYLKYKEVYHVVESLKDEPNTSAKYVHSDVMFSAYFGQG